MSTPIVLSSCNCHCFSSLSVTKIYLFLNSFFLFLGHVIDSSVQFRSSQKMPRICLFRLSRNCKSGQRRKLMRISMITGNIRALCGTHAKNTYFVYSRELNLPGNDLNYSSLVNNHSMANTVVSKFHRTPDRSTSLKYTLTGLLHSVITVVLFYTGFYTRG